LPSASTSRRDGDEPVCNIGSLADLTDYFGSLARASPYLRPLSISQQLVDGPAAVRRADRDPGADGRPDPSQGRDFAAKRIVPLAMAACRGPGSSTRLLGHVRAPEVVASMETHCPQDGRNATARSVAALRRIAGEIGVTIV
jgi:hypothetical protein